MPKSHQKKSLLGPFLVVEGMLHAVVLADVELAEGVIAQHGRSVRPSDMDESCMDRAQHRIASTNDVR